MEQCCEYIWSIQYKLHMMGIALDRLTNIFGNNKYVRCNTTISDSMLKKKSQSISYHLLRERAARDEWRTAYVNTHENPSELLTKLLPMSEK